MKKRKKIFLFMLTLVLSTGLMLTGCSNDASDDDTNVNDSADEEKRETNETGESDEVTSDEKNVIIGSSNMSDPFYSWLTNSIASHFDNEYPEVNYKIVDLQGDDAKVPAIIEQAIIEGSDGLIIDKPSHAQDTDEMLQNAKKEGVNTLLANNSDVQDGVSSNTGASNYILGYNVGLKAVELLPEGANVCVIMSSPGDSGSEDRWTGYQDALDEKGRDDINILDVKNNDGWAKEKAMQIMDDWLMVHDNIDAVLAMNDGMALGCIEAAKAAGKDTKEMQFYGIDGLGDACLSIKDGELTASVLQDADDMASNSVRIIMKMINGEITEPEEYLITPIIISNENVDEIIQLHKDNGAL